MECKGRGSCPTGVDKWYFDDVKACVKIDSSHSVNWHIDMYVCISLCTLYCKLHIHKYIYIGNNNLCVRANYILEGHMVSLFNIIDFISTGIFISYLFL